MTTKFSPAPPDAAGGPAALDRATDGELIQALARKDGAAAREVWRRFAPLVRRIVLRTLGPTAEVDDVCQDVFIALFEGASALREPAAAKAFVISIATFRVRYHLRWRRIRRWLSFSDDAEALDRRIEHPNGEAREAIDRFFGILDRLNASDRVAFTLRYVEEMELTDVAAAMDVSVATVKRRVSHAWGRLEKLVAADPELADLLPRLGGPRR